MLGREREADCWEVAILVCSVCENASCCALLIRALFCIKGLRSPNRSNKSMT